MTTSEDSRRAPCAVCSADFGLAELVSVGGYPLCQPCLEKTSSEVGAVGPRFHKIEDGKAIYGVCGGLADGFGIDRDVFRAIVVIIGVFTGFVPVIAIYMILAFVLPHDAPFDAD